MYVTGIASSSVELLEKINETLTTKLGDNNWKLVHYYNGQHDKYMGMCYAVWEGKGDGNDKIYVQMRVPHIQDEYATIITEPNKIALDGLAGFDNGLKYYDQAGSIQKWLQADGSAEVAQPMFTCTMDSQFSYWIIANAYRFVVVVKMSTVYESMYAGFLKPITSEKQYPYPIYIGGNGNMTGQAWYGNKNGSFIFPSDGSGYLRRADGSWRKFDAFGDSSVKPNPFSLGTIFPYNADNKKLIPNYIEGTLENLDNNLMIPIILCTTEPYDMCGMLDDVHFVSGTRDIASEQIMTIGSEQYIVFSVKDWYSANTYFSVKLV